MLTRERIASRKEGGNFIAASAHEPCPDRRSDGREIHAAGIALLQMGDHLSHVLDACSPGGGNRLLDRCLGLLGPERLGHEGADNRNLAALLLREILAACLLISG